jgi:outer membrane protein TolC
VTQLGLPENTTVKIVPDGLITTKSSFDEQSGIKNALSMRPELKAADIRISASKRMLKMTRGIYSPVLSAGFNYYYSKPNQRVFIEDQVRFHDSWDIGVRLSWNITNLFTTQFQTKEAKLNLQQSQTMQEQLSENIRMEVNANYAAYKLALDKIQLNDKTVAQSTENRDMTKNQYENGIKNITDMLDADNLVTASQINLLNAKIDAEIAYAKLLRSTAN